MEYLGRISELLPPPVRATAALGLMTRIDEFELLRGSSSPHFEKNNTFRSPCAREPAAQAFLPSGTGAGRITRW
jgi:hypothetical protein